MAELAASTDAEVLNELLGRESFKGCVVNVTLGEGNARDLVLPYYSDSIADEPSHRRRGWLERAANYIGTPPAIE